MKKYLTILLLGAFAPFLHAENSWTPVPKMDKMVDNYRNYLYMYPRVQAPTCAPSIKNRAPEWYEKYKKEIMVDETQNSLFYNEFLEIAKKEGARVSRQSGVGQFVSWQRTYSNSRVALTICNLCLILDEMEAKHIFSHKHLVSGKFDLHDLKDIDVVKPDVLFINYSHADDYSLLGIPASELPEIDRKIKRFSGPDASNRNRNWLRKFFPGGESLSERFAEVNKFGPTRNKKEERVYVLNVLEYLGIEVRLFNRFYDIPDYIRNHSNVTILKDKSDFNNYDFEPHTYTWTNTYGKKIQAGFLGTPFRLNKRSGNERTIALFTNGKIYNINANYLSKESRILARRLSYPGLQPWDYYID